MDAWTAAFFWPLDPTRPEPPTSAQLAVRDPAGAPLLSPDQQAVVERLRGQVGFFHWELEFPDVFERGGFDCVLGNPPWEKLEMDELEFFATRDPDIAALAGDKRKQAIAQLEQTDRPLWREFQAAFTTVETITNFARGSGRFPLTGSGRVNLYALFAEHDRAIVNDRGRAGVIVPTGIATDDTTKAFFADLIEARSLRGITGFENEELIFPGVHHVYKFCLLVMGETTTKPSNLVFFCRRIEHARDERRQFQISAEDFALINPNTRTCPIFRTRADADLTRAIYRRVPVLVDEGAGTNPWGIQFMQGLFNMTSASSLFRDAPGSGLVPLYEAKLFHQFEHRLGTYAGRRPGSEDSELPRSTIAQLQDPS